MRKTPFLFGAFGLLALGTVAYADDTTMVPQANPAPSPTHKPAQTHQQGMQHGGQTMHDTMMKDHASGMKKKKGMQSSSDKPPMKKGCCMGKTMPSMPADKPMPMHDDM
jgi:periplasmic protein CpxP/Spy